MYCEQCGADLSDEARYCSSCGKRLVRTELQKYKDYDTREILHYGWNVWKTNAAPSLLIPAITLIALLIPDKGLAALIAFIYNIYSNMLLTKIAIAVPEGTFKLDKNLFFSNKTNVIDFAGANILFMIITLVGFVLFVVPGVYFYIRLCMWNFIVVDENANPYIALQRSWDLTRGREWQIIKWALTAFGVWLLGLLCLLVGIVVAVPVTTYSSYYVYRKFKYGK